MSGVIVLLLSNMHYFVQGQFDYITTQNFSNQTPTTQILIHYREKADKTHSTISIL